MAFAHVVLVLLVYASRAYPLHATQHCQARMAAWMMAAHAQAHSIDTTYLTVFIVYIVAACTCTSMTAKLMFLQHDAGCFTFYLMLSVRVCT